MRKLLLVPLLFLPAIAALVFEYYLTNFNTMRLQNFAENILFGTLFFLLASLIKPGKTRSIFFSIVMILYTISIWFETIFYYLYESTLNTSSVYVMIESSVTDIKAFFETQVNTPIILFTIFLFVSLVFLIPFLVKKFINFSWFIKPTNAKRVAGAIASFLAIVILLLISDLINQNLPYKLFETSKQYQQKTDKFKGLEVTDKVGYFKNSIRERSYDNETFVIVIGESHTRQKMSLYGYDRATNPKLLAIKDELVVFDDVISATSSYLALRQALTFSIDSLETKKASVVQLFNSVGFKSFWLSNQAPFGEHSFMTEMAKAADENKFINILNPEKTTPYDGDLLIPFNEAIHDPYEKKVIFIHLMGNHFDYEKRFPKAFEVFKTEDDKHPEIEGIIDDYDNATVYNDYVLSKIIEALKQTDGDTYMLYFSDHGEEVYQTADSFGHDENEATQPVYDIPFFLWLSEPFKKSRPIRYRPYRSYLTEDLIHSIAHLSDIKFDGYDASKSVFSIYFKEKTRIIQGDIDYDKLYE